MRSSAQRKPFKHLNGKTPSKKRRSLLERFKPTAASHHQNSYGGDGYAKEAHPNQSFSFAPTATAAATTTAPKTHTSLRARFDALLPPHKTYLGLSRKRFLLFVVLPLAILILFVLPLALGLGLSKRGGKQDLPLPNNKDTHTGDLTYYDVGLGACGKTNSNDDFIVSVSHYLWDDVQEGGNPNTNLLCGKKIRIRREGEGSVDVTVVDRCTGCKPTDLDMSPAAFQRLADKAEGRVTGTWSWLD
ncbi:uncharacterized protein CTRU02_210444 [Colletotrichum truncatum]|uniref:Uncharacterized protein n=1 Tax=Colletotrichum truncatum TaxID=5467 RepID=A0ACC3YP23_COLTU|nr:uncharacterized protein CTRU02_13955 [Colletotrichum truncatum]KAF6782798.1 hypothetical protein CTRU02_13955 [Colletotrichum truncatum]